MLDRRGLPGRERARDDLRGRAGGWRVRRQHVVLFGHQIDSHFWAYVPSAVAGHARQPRRLAASAGGSASGRPAAARAPRQVAAPLARADRARRGAGSTAAATLAVPLGLVDAASSARSSRSPPASFRCRSRGSSCSTLIGCGDLLLRLRRRRLGARKSYRRATPRFHVVSIAIVRCGRRRVGSWLAWVVLATLDRGVPMIPLVDVKAQYAPLIPELKAALRRGARVGPVHPRAECRRLRGGGGRLSRRPADDRRRERHGRARDRPRCAWASAPATR